jgi:cyclic dehypoxanthinyl futalosine synthase
MQGGTNPNLPFSYYTDLLKGIKSRFDITMHSFSPAEILKMKEVSGGLSLEEVVRQLKEAGLDSLPGGGAEILDDRTRRKISRLKGSWRDWMDVMQTAHRLGMNTTATMVIRFIFSVFGMPRMTVSSTSILLQVSWPLSPGRSSRITPTSRRNGPPRRNI